jgi:hypothetical protein
MAWRDAAISLPIITDRYLPVLTASDQDDGMMPVELLRHSRDEVFVVRFLADGNEMQVDLVACLFHVLCVYTGGCDM